MEKGIGNNLKSIRVSCMIIVADYELTRLSTFDSSNPGWGYRKFIKRSDLLQRKSELAPSNMLTIVCTKKMKKRMSDLDSSKYEVGII